MLVHPLLSVPFESKFGLSQKERLAMHKSRNSSVLRRIVFPVFALLTLLAAVSSAQVNVTTFHNDNARSGVNAKETILTPANVNVSAFGRKFTQPVDGYLYAQPLYLANVAIPGKGTHNVAYVATENDTVYAYDADNNLGTNAQPLWKTSFAHPPAVTAVPSGDTGCGDLTPKIGITSTPVIDLASHTVYVVAKTKESGHYFQRLHALDVATGAERTGSPVEIKVNGPISFDPLIHGQRPGLLLQNGQVYIAWASHCDIGAYHGWIMSYNKTTLKQTGVLNLTPNGSLGGVWQSGAGPAADSTGVYFATGNGTFDADQGGGDYGDSILRLSAPAGGKLPVKDFFTPYNQDILNNTDADLGSGGVVLLPNQTGPYKHLLIQAGKEGSIYVIDRDGMGKYNPNNNNQIVQFLPTVVGGLWSMPAFWNNTLYIGGAGDNLHQFSFDPVAGKLSSTPLYQTPTFFNFPSTTPSVSSNGTVNGIVWALSTDTAPAILHAYDATRIDKELYSSSQKVGRDAPGQPVKFAVPTIANGKVYVGTRNRLAVYGLLP